MVFGVMRREGICTANETDGNEGEGRWWLMELSDNFHQGRRCTRSFSQAPGDDGSLDPSRFLTVSKVSAEARAN